MDEPTSGLDSFSCYKVIKVLKNLVKTSSTDSPIAIVTTIHQPSSKIFYMFDQIYAISFNGQCLYANPPLKLVEYLSDFGLLCPNNYNPSDFLIEICCGDQGLNKLNELIEAQKLNFIAKHPIESQVKQTERYV